MAGAFRKFLSFTVVRLILACIFTLAPVIGVSAIAKALIHDKQTGFLVATLGITLLVYLGYRLYVHLIEQRPCTELAFAGSGKQLGAGLLLGTALFSATIGILALAGAYHVLGPGSWKNLAAPLVLAIASGIAEEIIFRGIVFRLIEQSLGTWLSLLISALIFGAIHIGNPHATVVSGLAIMFEAGILLAALYMVTRRLWLSIGTHMAWNFVQGGIFGVAVSGLESKGLLQGKLTGPVWLSGGEFGAEASIVAIVLCLGVAVVFIVKARKGGQILRPFWRRAGSATSSAPSLQTP